MPHSRRRFSIASLSTTVTLVPLLVVSVALIGISQRSARRLSEDLADALVEQTVERTRDSVSRYLSQVTRLSDELTGSINTGAIDADDFNAWQARFGACLDSNPELASIGYADVLHGRYLYLARLDDKRTVGEVGSVGEGQIETWTVDARGVPIADTRRVGPYVLEARPWYRQAINARDATWTTPYDWFAGWRPTAVTSSTRGIAYTRIVRTPTTQPFPAVSIRLYDGRRGFPRPSDGSIRGVLAIDLELDQIGSYLDDIAQPLDASLIISDASSNVIVASDPRLSMDWPRADPSLDGSDGAAVEAAVARALRERGRDCFLRNGQTYPQQLESGGHTFWVTELPITVAPNVSWRLLVAMPEPAVVLNAQQDIRRSIWIGAGYVTLAAIISVVLARWLARPFRRLATFAARIGSGEFDQRLDLADGGMPREVAELSDTLNRMAQALRERVALLSAKDAAEQAGAAKARLIAHVSHEFRTPLNAIVGYAELLRSAARSAGRSGDADDAGNILIASRQLLKLVENLLDLSRAEAGRLPLTFVEFAVQDLIEEVIATVRPVVERNGNRFRVSIGTDGIRMLSDPQRLREILLNLLGNAGKFTEQGDVTLAVSHEEQGDAIRFEVTDTGPGIDPRQMANVFEPFVQIHRDGGSAVGQRHEGAGLGLAIARQLTELLGGTIELDSNLGKGTRVCLVLPRTHQIKP